MTITDLYLVCFIVGLLLSLISFLFGTLHLHVHLPGLGHGPHFGGGLHAPHAPHAPHAGHAAPHGAGSEMPLFNFGTVTAFLAWFGGVGYLLTKHTQLYAAAAVALSSIAGVIGAGLVFLFVVKVLMRHDRDLDPADYSMIGVFGSITSPIRRGGTGEIVYSQQGTRRTAGARSEDGAAITKGTEVVVTRYEKGIAYVRPWDQLSASPRELSTTDSTQ